MFKEANHIVAGIMLISLIFVSCNSDVDNIEQIRNSSPKYTDKTYVDIVKSHSIDVTQIGMLSKESDFDRLIDFDVRNNMYILDPYESKVWVFNEDGKLVRNFGRPGQGPEEFDRPNSIVIKGGNIYVFQGFYEYKIVDFEGHYISSHLAQIENRLKVKAIGENFYLFRGKTDRTLTKLELILSIEDDSFSGGKVIFKYIYPPGLAGPSYDFRWHNWLLISDNGEFYFPEDNLRKYSIIKYNKEGRPKLIFGRQYHIKEYSKEAKNRFYSIYEREIEKGELEFPISPPIVVNMFQDKKKNIWVISGETYEDNMNPNYENSIDIFNEKGEWLYSFKSKSLSRYCIYNNGMIYKIMPVNLDTYDQYIEVYKIKYYED